MTFCINSRKRKLHLFFSFSRIGERKKESIYDGEKLKQAKTASYPEAKE
jgi:hypothetical protein